MLVQKVLPVVLIFLLFASCKTPSSNQSFPVGHPDIDRIRKEIHNIKFDSSNKKERINTLRLWIRYLSYAGADLNPLRDFWTENILYPGDSLVTPASLKKAYSIADSIYNHFSQNPDQFLVSLKRKEIITEELPHDWKTLRGNPGQTGFTTQPGPVEGKLKWKFPAPHACYSTPAFENDRVYIGSPGVSYEAYCLDANTGKIIWRTLQKENQNQYRTPRISSPTLISGDHIVVREIGSLGNSGPAKDFVFIDKKTGKEIKEITAGHVDYRVGYAPFDGNQESLVYPHSRQEIGSGEMTGEVDVVSFDTLVCIDIQNGQRKWAYYMGEFFSEPLLTDEYVFAGNTAGIFRCINARTGKLSWKVKTSAAINGKASYKNGHVLISNQAGRIMLLHAKTGNLKWDNSLPVENHAFQLLSKAVIHENMVYIGSTDRNLYALNLATGKIHWKIQLDDWIRSAPLVIEDKLIVATCKGTVYGLNVKNKPEINWKISASTHGIFADLTAYEGSVFVTSSDYYMISIDPAEGKINWKTSIFESIENNKGERILADLVGGGPDYQAGITIADSIAYFGSPRFVYAVDIASGKERWKFETRGQICGAPAIDNDRVFFGQQGGTNKFYCLDAKTGNLQWTKDLAWVWGSPLAEAGKLYIASVKGTFSCLDQATGKIIWQFESKEGAYPAPSMEGETVFFGSWNGKYYAFNRNTGELIWQYDIDGHPDSGASMVNDGIFYGQGFMSNEFHAIDSKSGTPIWKYDIGKEWCNASPATDGHYLLYSTYIKWLHQAPQPSHTHCIDAKTGKYLYTLPFSGGLTGAVICNDLVFSASTTDSYMRAWDLANGNIRWQYRMGGRAEESCTSIYGNMAFILCTDGYLYAFE